MIFFVGVNKHKRYLHALGNDIFNVHGCKTSALEIKGMPVVSQLCKSCKIRSQFNEDTVALNASNNTRNGLTGGEKRRIFLPSAEKLTH